MNIVFLNGSPKRDNSTSQFLLKALATQLPAKATAWYQATLCDSDLLAEAITQSDILIIAFPLYVDGIPAPLLGLMESLEPLLCQQPQRARVYALANSGFYDAHQNRHALEMVKLWSKKSGLIWGQGIGAGAGGMIQAAPLGKGPARNLGKTLTEFADIISTRRSCPNTFSEPNFPRFLYQQMAHLGWQQQARKNGLKPHLLRQQHGLITASPTTKPG